MISSGNLNKLKIFWWGFVIISILMSCIVGWFGESIKFRWTKGIPDDYYRNGNIYIGKLDEKIWGIDLKNNLLTVKGKKTKGWYVKAYVKWSSSGRKCLARKDLSENPKMIPRRYEVEYYGIDLGKEYIISVPQQVDHNINRCSDTIYSLSIRFYDRDISAGGFTINYFDREFESGQKFGYPNPNRVSYCWKEPVYDNSSDVYVGFCKTEENASSPHYVYHDQIRPYTINLDFYFLDEEPSDK
ncbi:hypothetical protein KCM76_21580 [Zooshikella marina]|uniref:hypothetical protein n=1 Tax=Zooshikella ganghwensis TaxID=202772 RepID=UPI001BAEE148|nr:hypothetical protein [Zooshikella ganghwensis]MBU2708598.1 hypothetical protein [Zooshikella ganghwensis]